MDALCKTSRNQVAVDLERRPGVVFTGQGLESEGLGTVLKSKSQSSSQNGGSFQDREQECQMAEPSTKRNQSVD